MSVPASLWEVKCIPALDDLHRACLAECDHGGLYMEFGVSTGASLKSLRAMIPAEYTLYGFDSFDGLPEAWAGHPVGAYASGHRVSLPNTILVEGLFADTLPKFAAAHKERASFIHVDCDLYSSTKTVLNEFRENIVPGTVIVFDEFFGYEGWEDHESKAFAEFDRKYECIARDNDYRLGVKIL